MKTIAELGISQQEFDALLKTREILSEPDVPMLIAHDDVVPTTKGVLFDMSTSSEHYDCGTALCIGGFMKLFMMGVRPKSDGRFSITSAREEKIDVYVMSHNQENAGRPIAKLFYPEIGETDVGWSTLTKAEAIKAIDNFLETGNPDWAGVVAERA